jgi:hypothetical protein
VLLAAPKPTRTAAFGRYAELDPSVYVKLGPEEIASHLEELRLALARGGHGSHGSRVARARDMLCGQMRYAFGDA